MSEPITKTASRVPSSSPVPQRTPWAACAAQAHPPAIKTQPPTSAAIRPSDSRPTSSHQTRAAYRPASAFLKAALPPRSPVTSAAGIVSPFSSCTRPCVSM